MGRECSFARGAGGRCVPGYERLWWEMERELERLRKGNPSNASKF